MRFAIADYGCVVFDCDGVILDSNRIKSDAFYSVSLRFGQDIASRFVSYHQRHGGITRYDKFRYLLDDVLHVAPANRDTLMEELLHSYAAICAAGLLQCALIPGVGAVLDSLTGQTDAYVVTGGTQSEVRGVFAARGLERYFRGIFGGPVSKRSNMEELARNGVFAGRSLYFGDAELDMRLAEDFGLEFIFVHGASEWSRGRDVCSHRQIADFTMLYAEQPAS